MKEKGGEIRAREWAESESGDVDEVEVSRSVAPEVNIKDGGQLVCSRRGTARVNGEEKRA
jgi:hypothetical protein